MSERQYPLQLPPLRRLGREDFMPGEANRTALAFVEAWPEWSAPSLILVGPAGSGKSHLASIWQARAQALLLDAAAFAGRPPRELLGEARAVAIEDLDRALAAEPGLAPAFYAVFTAMAERRGWLLLTGRQPPARWPVALKDLRSRLLAAPTVAIGRPDDQLLHAVLVKLLADRQLEADPKVLAFLMARAERSLAGLVRLVERLDARALEGRSGRRRVTVPLARRCLELLDSERPEAG